MVHGEIALGHQQRRKHTADTDENLIVSDSSAERPENSNNENHAVSIEGTLLMRKGRASGNSTWQWKRRWVVFRFDDGGSVSIYKKEQRQQQQQEQEVSRTRLRSTLHRLDSTLDLCAAQEQRTVPVLDIPPDVPWIVKDIPQDPSTFVIEIATGDDDHDHDDEGDNDRDGMAGEDTYSLDDNSLDGLDDLFSVDGTVDRNQGGGSFVNELAHAQHLGKPYRVYFQCYHNPDEKALWIKAFSNAGRLSHDVRRKAPLLLRSLTTYHAAASRVRNTATARIAREARQLDAQRSINAHEHQQPMDPSRDVEFLVRGPRHAPDKEFRCQPTYAYPHQWMTKAEMREEMILPSEHVHDLRVPDGTATEIGSLQVEVLQCLGLPRLDRGSDSDAVVYMVVGSHAFCTDIIYSRANPMWFRKSRRACEFPLHHGYARLYVGVFDDEPRKVKDDFAGRVVVDLARLRPRSTYDVTLPLRLSTHVYSRRRRGSIRLRLTVRWKTERAALLSYVPRSLRIPLPQHSRPNLSTTVMCSDQKAFRNIAITVHGAHLPGRFTFTQLRAVIREINFTRKFVFTTLLETIHATCRWRNPAISAYIFLSWMHCIYANCFSLVPAYVMFYLFLILMQNYARYNVDGPSQRGFVPPSWEELLLALIRGGSDPHRSPAIAPLSLTVDHSTPRLRGQPPQISVRTHEPKGKKLFEALGFINTSGEKNERANLDPNKDHLEFPFAEGRLYPKFTVRESLVVHGKEQELQRSNSMESRPALKSSSMSASTSSLTINENGEIHKKRFKVDVDWMKKDFSGTKEFDEEANKFRAVGAVISKGRKAASRVTRTATAITSKTGLDHVIEPIQSGITTGVGHVSSGVAQVSSGVANGVAQGVSGVASGVAQVSSGVASGVANKMGHMSTRASNNLKSFKRQSKHWGSGGLEVFETSQDDLATFEQFRMQRETEPGIRSHMYSFDSDLEGFLADDDILDDGMSDDGLGDLVANQQHGLDNLHPLDRSDGSNSKSVPDQDIDIQGPSTGRKLTEDLAEARDKMHELTWHRFNDHTYTLKNRDALFFEESKKPEKWRKKNTAKLMDRYLHMGKYSHNNPFVARVGTYVQPIVSSIYGVLCVFRALFNVITWRDPSLTFLLSFFCGVSSIVLYFFPWRIFLFFVGFYVVGPQNWAIRILREQGHLPPVQRRQKATEDMSVWDNVPTNVPLFTAKRRKPGNDPRSAIDTSVDPREVHHIVVPYGPLIHQRCNDWPPEPEYAHVMPEADRGGSKSFLPRRRTSTDGDTSTLASTTSTRIGRFRKRLQNHRNEQMLQKKQR